MNMIPVPEYDPALFVAVNAHPSARQAHHEAGHAVAAVLRGFTLPGVRLGTDWSVNDTSTDASSGRWHDTPWESRLFITFAGPWAEAMWHLEHGEANDLHEALEYSWLTNDDGDAAKYQAGVEILCAYAKVLGFGSSIAGAWESHWIDELDALWPAVCEVAAMLIDGHLVTHEKVLAAMGAGE